MAKPVGNFSAFLEEMNRGKSQPPCDSSQQLVMLAKLKQAPEHRMMAPELRRESEMSIVDFAKVVEGFEKAGLIHLNGPPGEEIISLTETGLAAAEAA